MDEGKNSQKSEAAKREEDILAFWAKHDVFNKTLLKEAPNGDFIFYDGPPFATGLPHYGHILAGTIKDAIPRYKTMCGYRVPRKWGWDCHGLPLENIIEDRLGMKTKREIEEFGIEKFNQAARDAVLEYADDWRRIVPRMGRWVDMEDDYKTMDASYTESVWWVFSELHRKGLVFEGFKSMHLCPRCGTTLSNFEVNQGYKDIKDIAVTVKLPLLDEEGKETNESLLVWTTTPWTLPGNMAAAVHEDYEYVSVKRDEGNNVILAKDRLEAVAGGEEYTVVKEMKGSELVGRRYKPPFDYYKDRDVEGKENAWIIRHAPYVELSEGTGAVHLAPAYGEEDMQLAKEYGVPVVHHVDGEGRFMDFITDFAGQAVKPKDTKEEPQKHLEADIEVVKALSTHGRLFKKENITHSYPLCWRCDTPLLNYATTSWFVRVPDVKDSLVRENEKIHWVPEHVGKARFGNWLKDARDWAVSRQRYWGAPLPIWRNEKTNEYKVFGSLKELQEYVPKSGNSYFLMRHGESESNVKRILNAEPHTSNGLTEKGVRQVREAMSKIPQDVDLVIYSPLQRTRETVEIFKESLSLNEGQYVLDDRVREIGMGEFEGRPTKDRTFEKPEDEFTETKGGMENLNDLRVRMGTFLYDLEQKYQNKKILIVSHGDPLWILESVMQGADVERTLALGKETYITNAEIRECTFTPFPHNRHYELDFHRPYIDEIELVDTDGTKLTRVPDVFDCWFESGSMPYGQHHYPFENTDAFEPKSGWFRKAKGYPADFISEGLDQTRGWFYSLLVLGTALFGKRSFKNVIVNGLVLAEDGRKMSKRLQNYPDPVYVADAYGVDTMRFYMLSSSLMRSEDLNFSEKELAELARKNIGRLHNVLSFYEMVHTDEILPNSDSSHVLDAWIVMRLNQLITQATTGFERYELDRATRPITDFIDDLSVWYLRRSRDRLKDGDREATATLRFVLRELAKVMAPSMPFYAEHLYQKVREKSDSESVHLESWPRVGELNEKMFAAMKRTRDVASLGLEARSRADIKVRQPLAVLTIKGNEEEMTKEHLELIRDEVNVKEVVFDEVLESDVVLDTQLTEELKREGEVRELIRGIQDLRKEKALTPEERVALTVSGDAYVRELVEHSLEEIKKTTSLSSVHFAETEGVEVRLGERAVIISL